MKSTKSDEDIEIELILPQDALDFVRSYAAEHGTTVEILARQYFEKLRAITSAC